MHMPVIVDFYYEGRVGPYLLLGLQQLHLKDEGGVGRDDGRAAAGAVREGGVDDQRALAAHAHAGHAQVPALRGEVRRRGEAR